ncbi:hypothetical protein M413DRAFT_439102 [Hebeloma cylindrosporum]|uniref:Uncharacterized protein n=1 Tax=Hebeloma cylindrosporum TaxID=76867 RepID=A0A0C3CTL2_HEBCY|nr:hypothetical protein M413DRAFT_439102 [Hebeloma cylindrosporum h7]
MPTEFLSFVFTTLWHECNFVFEPGSPKTLAGHDTVSADQPTGVHLSEFYCAERGANFRIFIQETLRLP